MPLKVLIGVNLVQLAQPFDRDTQSSLVSYSAVCKDNYYVDFWIRTQWKASSSLVNEAKGF